MSAADEDAIAKVYAEVYHSVDFNDRGLNADDPDRWHQIVESTVREVFASKCLAALSARVQTLTEERDEANRSLDLVRMLRDEMQDTAGAAVAAKAMAYVNLTRAEAERDAAVAARDAAIEERDEWKRTASIREQQADERGQVIGQHITRAIRAEAARDVITQAVEKALAEYHHADTCASELSPDAGYDCSCWRSDLVAAVRAAVPEEEQR